MTNLELVILLERISGLIGLGLLTIQIYLGANHKKISFHKILGIITFFLVFLHPALYILNKYIFISDFDPLYVFIDVCALCQNKYEYYINFGRVSFWLILTAIIAIKTKYWKFHKLNYIAFYFISIHAFFVGTDFKNPFVITYFVFLQLVVLASLFNKYIYRKAS